MTIIRWAALALLSLTLFAFPAAGQQAANKYGGQDVNLRSAVTGGTIGDDPYRPLFTTCVSQTAVACATGGVDAGGTARPLLTDGSGVLAAPKAGTANRVITNTSVSATTSTQICPTATAPVSTEIQTSVGNVGLGLNGQSLTAATLGTTTADADIVIPVAFTVYQPPVAPTNVITAYSASPFVAVCIQTIRQ